MKINFAKVIGFYPTKEQYKEALTQLDKSLLAITNAVTEGNNKEALDEVRKLYNRTGAHSKIIMRVEYLKNKLEEAKSDEKKNETQLKLDEAKRVLDNMVKTIKSVPGYETVYDPGRAFGAPLTDGGKKQTSRRKRATIIKRKKSNSKQKSKRRYLR
jgi:hypothetical protein